MRWNKAKALPILLAAALMLGTPAGAVQAEPYEGKDDWKVTFTSKKKMDSNFKSERIDDELKHLQPGDEAEFEVAVTNEYPETTNWYMSNEILKSMETSANGAKGGCYSYTLTYQGPGDSEPTVIYDSDTVGGDDISTAGEGLMEATDALKEFFYLDQLDEGDKGVVRVKVGLEGETLGNAYQDTLAELQMNFAVELVEKPKPDTDTATRKGKPTPPKRKIVKTGDDSNLLPYFIMGAVSGLLLLLLGFVSLSMRKKDQKNGKGAK